MPSQSGGGSSTVTISGTPVVTMGGTPNVAVTSHTTQNETLYTSSARTSTPTAVTFTNEHNRGILIVVSVTTGAATPSVTPSLAYADPVTGSYITLWTAAAAITSTGAASYKYLVYPGIGTTEEAGITENVPLPLPRSMQLTMTHGDADSLTYSVGAIRLV